MKIKDIKRVLNDTDYIREGGSDEELRAAEYIKDICIENGASCCIESFPVQMAEIKKGLLYADGKEIPCKAFRNCGNWDIEAPFMYLPNVGADSLKLVSGKVVLIDQGVTYFLLHDLFENGCKGIITHDGNVNFADHDIDQKELRAFVSDGIRIPCININVKDAVKLVKNETESVRMVIEQNEYEGLSRNVVAEIKGEKDEYITMTAHYDSTSLSHGAYDNVTGCIGLLGVMEEIAKKKPVYSVRFVFCGSEERGLLGSKAYCLAHENELSKCVLNINLDMIGTIMGKFIACCTAEERLKGYISYLAAECGFGMNAYQGVYSSDSTPFADKGVPAVSFARIAGDSIAPIHNRYDTKGVLSPKQIASDIDFIAGFTSHMAYAKVCPVKRDMPDDLKKQLDEYLNRRRKD